MNHAYCSIFDLDETLIRPKSMLGVLKTYYRMSARSSTDGELRIKQMHERTTSFIQAGNDRCAQNRWFYRQFKGMKVAAMQSAAQSWFEQEKPMLYHDEVLGELAAHQHNGATILLATGSFREAVEPIMRDLNINHLVCADLEVVDGEYTGEMQTAPTIGQGKADALHKYLDVRGISLDGSYAYGDHDSDIPLLALAQSPVAVGDHPSLIRHAESHGWRVLHNLQE